MWRVIFPVLAYLLVAAHFLRNDEQFLLAVALLLSGLLAVPRAWVAHVSRWALFVSSLVWLNALVSMAAIRYSMGLPFLRLTLILVAVIGLTLASILVFSHPRVRRFYRLAQG